MKPGFTRLNLTYFADDKEIDYILNAIEFLAHHAWKFLPLVKTHSNFPFQNSLV